MTAPKTGRHPIADAVAPPEKGPAGRRRRAWLRAGCVLLVVAVYLSLWTAYALNGLTSHGRYRQYEAGAPASAMGAEFRLVSLVQTTQLTNSITGEISAPPANAVFLVARLDVVRRSDDPDLFCSFAILGPDRRNWEPNTAYVSRGLDSTCPREDMPPLGRTLPLEVIFQVPERYVGDLAGVAVDDPVSRGVRPVLTPP
ncbi:MAG TPA: hypothetical protein VIT65_03335 [Microlunatus sp.]